jgi:hypothetical protein
MDENSYCLNNFINSVKPYNELSKNNAAYFWLKDRIENGKYNEIKNPIFQKCDNITSLKKSFIITAVFLANSEPCFIKDLIKFHLEFLILYPYHRESLQCLIKEEILKSF